MLYVCHEQETVRGMVGERLSLAAEIKQSVFEKRVQRITVEACSRTTSIAFLSSLKPRNTGRDLRLGDVTQKSLTTSQHPRGTGRVAFGFSGMPRTMGDWNSCRLRLLD
jgi:hypothetical protein